MQQFKLFLRERLAYLRAQQVLPIPPNDNDLFLVEFPKSGITWLSFLIANTLLILSGDKRRATFFNIDDFVSDVHVRRKIQSAPILSLGYRLIKSHAAFTPCYKKVLYIVRDPRHVMTSYHTFLSTLGWYAGSLDSMLAHSRFGIESWCRHVDGWLTKVSPSIPFVMVRYEDLLADPAKELGDIFQFLGWNLDSNIAEEAIACSTLDRMRASEQTLNARNPLHGEFSFVRKNGATTPRQALTIAQEQLIVETAGPMMDKLGYFK